MENYTKTMSSYWNKRYLAEEKVWGETPSKTAKHCLNLFSKYNIEKLLIPGTGYGRNSKLFSDKGYKVTGVEISEKACEIASKYDPSTKIYNGSVLDMPYDDEIYDGIYCFNVLHLFRLKERYEFIQKCKKSIKGSGLMFFTVFSDQEKSYGKGMEVEKDTFESKPSRPVHYFTEDDLIGHFKGMSIIDTFLIEDSEEHGEEGVHIHKLRCICVQKDIYD
ncbi:class I SAM-dependent methyltransferase [Brassicibacter mesophilus]|uniref:class I SAM-dependent methyltransferase n=1 Tax=Brassicibacter mesophilus TaxID=745119 RepID=UPI003D1F2E1C